MGDGFLYSEFACPDFPATEMYHNPDYKNNKAYAEFIKEQKALFNDKANWHIPTSTLWYTTHTVVYDIAKRELRVMVHEGLDRSDGILCCIALREHIRQAFRCDEIDEAQTMDL